MMVAREVRRFTQRGERTKVAPSGHSHCERATSCWHDQPLCLVSDTRTRALSPIGVKLLSRHAWSAASYSLAARPERWASHLVSALRCRERSALCWPRRKLTDNADPEGPGGIERNRSRDVHAISPTFALFTRSAGRATTPAPARRARSVSSRRLATPSLARFIPALHVACPVLP